MLLKSTHVNSDYIIYFLRHSPCQKQQIADISRCVFYDLFLFHLNIFWYVLKYLYSSENLISFDTFYTFWFGYNCNWRLNYAPSLFNKLTLLSNISKVRLIREFKLIPFNPHSIHLYATYNDYCSLRSFLNLNLRIHNGEGK